MRAWNYARRHQFHPFGAAHDLIQIKKKWIRSKGSSLPTTEDVRRTQPQYAFGAKHQVLESYIKSRHEGNLLILSSIPSS